MATGNVGHRPDVLGNNPNPSRMHRRLLALQLAIVAAASLQAQARDSLTVGYSPTECPPCAEWNAATPPIRLFGNVHYVGTRGLSAILLTSSAGHILIDAGLPESAPRIMASIAALGYRVEDVRLIVTSHTHYDHVGGLAALKRASGAVVAARARAAATIERGTAGPEDPQFRSALKFPPVPNVRVIDDGDTLRVGDIVVTAHATPGHTAGGTSWSWRSCEKGECIDFVYADSQTPVSDDGYLFTRNPTTLQDFERGFATLERLPCEVLLTPHPQASQLWERLEKNRLKDPEACRRYASNARQQLARRMAAEREAR